MEFPRRLSSARIEARANILLIQYGGQFGMIKQPPVPVDEILEKYIGLRLELDDLHSRFGLAGVHGAVLASTKQVFIDESLDPIEHPEKEGRFNFTIAHEIGHICLQHPAVGAAQFPPDNSNPRFVRDQKELEWQADKFASYLLMPKLLVIRAWEAKFGSDAPIEIAPDIEQLAVANGFPREEFVTEFAEQHAREFAVAFKVSVQAMRIRLQGLKLLPPA